MSLQVKPPSKDSHVHTLHRHMRFFWFWRGGGGDAQAQRHSRGSNVSDQVKPPPKPTATTCKWPTPVVFRLHSPPPTPAPRQNPKQIQQPLLTRHCHQGRSPPPLHCHLRPAAQEHWGCCRHSGTGWHQRTNCWHLWLGTTTAAAATAATAARVGSRRVAVRHEGSSVCMLQDGLLGCDCDDGRGSMQQWGSSDASAAWCLALTGRCSEQQQQQRQRCGMQPQEHMGGQVSHHAGGVSNPLRRRICHTFGG